MCYTSLTLVTPTIHLWPYTYMFFPRKSVQDFWAYPTCSSATWLCHSLIKRWSLSLQHWIWTSPATALNNWTQQRGGCASLGCSLASFVPFFLEVSCHVKNVTTLRKTHCEKVKVQEEARKDERPWGWRKWPRSNKAQMWQWRSHPGSGEQSKMVKSLRRW